MAGHRQPLTRRAVLAASGLVVLGACGDGYPPPLLAGTAAPTIRVRLGRSRPSARLRIAKQAWEIHAVAGRALSVRGSTDLSTDLAAGRDGIVVRGRSTGATTLRVQPSSTFSLGERAYRGTLIVRLRDSKLEFINELDLETYVAGVIGNEVGPKAETATYRAQAVTARTYAYIRVRAASADSRAFHVYDDSRSQVYTGMTMPAAYGIDYGEMLRCTRETRGVILTWQGRPFATYYSSTCGGHTTDAATSALDPGHADEVLRGVPCQHCRTSKYFSWTKVVRDADLAAGLQRAKRPVGLPIRSIEVTRRGRGDWVSELQLRGGPGGTVRTVPGTVFRTAAGLRSHNIRGIRRVGGGWSIEGRGWGHGVGMCQWGAIEMGRKGATETDILRYYYPGVAFTKVY
jgi:stage II sporulation protein D